MWFVHSERTDRCRISHGRIWREFRLSVLPHLSVDGSCHETKKVYEFNSCYWHGQTCLPFRDVTNFGGDTLAEICEQTMARFERITPAGYHVEVEWECHFDNEIMPHKPELATHLVVQHSPLNTRNAL